MLKKDYKCKNVFRKRVDYLDIVQKDLLSQVPWNMNLNTFKNMMSIVVYSKPTC